FHARRRHFGGEPSGAARDRFLHQPRSAAARIRGGTYPRRLDLWRLVRDVRPHDLDRRSHAPTRSCTYRVLPWHQDPVGPQVWAFAYPGWSAAAYRPAEPGERARPPYLDRALRRREGWRSPAQAGARSSKGRPQG